MISTTAFPPLHHDSYFTAGITLVQCSFSVVLSVCLTLLWLRVVAGESLSTEVVEWASDFHPHRSMFLQGHTGA